MRVITCSLALALVLAMSVEASAVTIDIIGDSTNSATNVGPNSNLGNGDYQSSIGSNPFPYTDIPNWHNASDAETINHGRNDGLGGDNPQNGVLPENIGAFQFNGRVNINDTGYSPNAGDVFSFGTYYAAFGGGTAPTDTLTATLYTSAVPVDGDVTVGDLTAVASTPALSVGSGNSFVSAPDFYTADGTEGTLYMGLTLSASNNVFTRVDLVSLSVEAIPEPGTMALVGLGSLGLLLSRRRNEK